ncbi:NAD-dependent epimerase/dehydratase family protein [Streptomyces sp. CB01881]|uniref:NAD-dependent epimerase/dehydratase family protein n=1 Tax=Streptomyces sp. CB01881 TaxID=2078691 RepID=UPI000CDC6C07|nr:NAD-dependent epimerase/dehydratase family protein [Streptomyces sp. CB01881]AUY50473.1 NAD-dependent epimerase [Streptomyces sp. CB01881]TYC73860.1 NAD-dependent epimerase/dehydratase family protein [Streptomyces sp. CB01881]
MRILVLGGGWFLGRAVVSGALERGWEVTTFTRGLSGIQVPGAVAVHGDRERAEDMARLAEHGPWDAVIDTSASELSPRAVLAGTRALEPVVGRYVYISTVSVYEGWPSEPLTVDSPTLDAPADAGPEYGQLPEGWPGPDTHYGQQKAGAERAVTEAFGLTRTSLLRPGVILGPGEYVGRLPWWLRRAERGGRILAPGDPAKSIQPVDVRDVAAFALDQVQRVGHQVHNVTAPVGRETMDGFLQACMDVTSSSGELVWVTDEVLLRSGLRQWTEIPLWRTHPGVWAIDSSSAIAAGFRSRPLSETVADTWTWLQQGNVPVPHQRWDEHGISPDKEDAILEGVR